jgi:hypothetical protein
MSLFTLEAIEVDVKCYRNSPVPAGKHTICFEKQVIMFGGLEWHGRIGKHEGEIFMFTIHEKKLYRTRIYQPSIKNYAGDIRQRIVDGRYEYLAGFCSSNDPSIMKTEIYDFKQVLDDPLLEAWYESIDPTKPSKMLDIEFPQVKVISESRQDEPKEPHSKVTWNELFEQIGIPEMYREKYAKIMVEILLDPEDLPHLTDNDIAKLIEPIGHQIKLRQFRNEPTIFTY